MQYQCSLQDKENLQSLQRQIQERIDFLNENDLDSYGDPQLLEFYELYGQIQQCIFSDHTDQYLLIVGVVTAMSFIFYFRWKMIKKAKSKKLDFLN